jgi:sigma-B regulation protein RsbU (phosphoserine phosphatase)
LPSFVDDPRKKGVPSDPGISKESDTPAGKDPVVTNRVLVVDDDPATLRLYEKVLGKIGYEVTAHSDGNSAWEAYQGVFYPIIILDWLMPGMDGLTLCRKMRAHDYGRLSVILVVTGCDQPEHLEEVLQAGADDYLTKPISVKIIEIRVAIARKHARIKQDQSVSQERLRQQRDELESSIKNVEQGKMEWESTADSLSELVCLLDSEGRLIRANRSIENWAGPFVEKAKGISLHRILHRDCKDPLCYLNTLWEEMQPGLDLGIPGAMEIEDKVLERYLRIQLRPIQRSAAGPDEPLPRSFAVAVLDDITERKAMEVELAQAREQEIDIGSKIQQSLLIGQPPEDIDGMKIAALSIPSQRIDGDFYAFFRHSDRMIDIIIGDVMGKGIPAALIGAATKSHFLSAMSRLLAASPARELPRPEEVVALVHERMAERLMELDSFVTLCYARFDLDCGEVTLVDCGHTRSLQHRHGAKIINTLQGENMPLGFSKEEVYRPVRVTFDPGDHFLFYSDGVIEAKKRATKDDPRRKPFDLFGEERLFTFLLRNAAKEPADLTEELRKTVSEFSGHGGYSDDVSCIAVKIDGGVEEEEPVAEPETSSLEITSDLTRLEEVRDFIKHFLQTAPSPVIDEDGASQLELAAIETVTNVMRHAYRSRPGFPLWIEAEILEDRVVIRVLHKGESFDTSCVPEPALDGTEEGGFGLYIIDNYVDEMTSERDDDGRVCIRLDKLRR